MLCLLLGDLIHRKGFNTKHVLTTSIACCLQSMPPFQTLNPSAQPPSGQLHLYDLQAFVSTVAILIHSHSLMVFSSSSSLPHVHKCHSYSWSSQNTGIFDASSLYFTSNLSASPAVSLSIFSQTHFP